MTRDTFKPATILNLLAGAWLQFMVHDWFVHARSKTEFIDIPTPPGDDFGEPSVRVPRSVPDAAPAGSNAAAGLRQPEQPLVGLLADLRRDPATAAKLRTKIGGKLRLEPTGLLPTDPETGLSFTGFTDNWWIGLAMLHTLFTQEHNYLCDLLAHEHPDWNDDQLFARARLINSALMAKIHTVEWTPAIVPHPIIKRAMNVIWSGLAGEELQDALQFLDDQELTGGIVGSKRGPPQRAVLADRGVRRRLPDASAHSRRGRVPLAGDRRSAREAAADGARGPQDAGDCRARDDARSLLFVRHVPSRRGDAAQLPAHAAEPAARRRRASRPGGGRHLPRPRARRASLQPVPPPAAQGAGEIVRRAHRQPGVAQADQGGLQQRSRERRPDDRPLRRAAARRASGSARPRSASSC